MKLSEQFDKAVELFGANGQRVTVIVRAEFPFEGQFVEAVFTNDDPYKLPGAIERCVGDEKVFQKSIPPFRRR